MLSQKIVEDYTKAYGEARAQDERGHASRALYLHASEIGMRIVMDPSIGEKTKATVRNGIKLALKRVSQPNKSTNQQPTNEVVDAKASSIPTETWDSIIGLPHTKEFIEVSTELARNQPQAFAAIGASSDRSILLYGPPGTGKTKIARAIANQLQSLYFELPPSEVFSKYVGESEKKIRAIFDAALKAEAAVIFIDELDSVCRQRSTGESAQHGNQVVTEVLQCMDAIKSKEKIFLVAATNHPDWLDPAIIRRMSLRLCVPLPDKKAREQMIQSFFGPLDDKSLSLAGEKTKNFNVSDIMNACNAAKLIPLKEAQGTVRWIKTEDGFFIPCTNESIDLVVYKQARDIPRGKMRSREPTADDLLSVVRDTKPSAIMNEVQELYNYAGKDLKDSEQS